MATSTAARSTSGRHRCECGDRRVSTFCVTASVETGYARYVGRIGALAVALGVGMAAATGSGIGLGAPIAHAHTEGDGGSSDGDTGTDRDGADKDDGGGGEARDGGAQRRSLNLGERSGEDAEGESGDNDDDNGNGAGARETNLNVGGGGAQIDGQQRQDDDEQDGETGEGLQGQGEVEQDGETGEGLPGQGEDEQDGETGEGLPGQGEGLTDGQGQVEVEQGQGENQGQGTPFTGGNSYVPPAGAGAVPAGTPIGAPVPDDSPALDADVIDPDASRIAGGDDSVSLSLFSLDADHAEPSLSLSMAAAAGTPAPAPLVFQPSNPIEAIVGGVGAIVNIITTAVTMFVSSILAPGPTTPAPPVMLFVVLGWAQRELQRTFFNQSPNAGVDAITTAEGDDVDIAVLANDTDGDLGVGDVLTVTDYTQPANGSVALNPNGTFTYTPDEDFNGTDTFSYTVSDGASPWHLHGPAGFFGGGHHDSTTTVTITVTPGEDNTGPPVADDDTATVNEGQSVAITVLDGDTDPDGNATIDPTSVEVVGQGANGTATANPDGTVTYTSHGAEGVTSDSFTYTVEDSSGAISNTATVNIAITPVDDAPVIQSVSPSAPQPATGAVTYTVTFTDADTPLTDVDLEVTQPLRRDGHRVAADEYGSRDVHLHLHTRSARTRRRLQHRSGRAGPLHDHGQ